MMAANLAKESVKSRFCGEITSFRVELLLRPHCKAEAAAKHLHTTEGGSCLRMPEVDETVLSKIPPTGERSGVVAAYRPSSLSAGKTGPGR